MMALIAVPVFVFTPIASYMMKKVVTRLNVFTSYLIYTVCLACNAITVYIWNNPIVYEIFSFLDVGLYVLLAIFLETYNFVQCPHQYGKQLGVLAIIAQNLG